MAGNIIIHATKIFSGTFCFEVRLVHMLRDDM